jgi:hypothetical protein
MKPGKSDPRIRVKISGLQLTELQEHTGAMCEAFGLDRKIERYKGTRPITLYHWDLECLLDILNWVLNDRKQYPDQETPKYIAVHEFHVRLKDLYKQTFPS